MSDSLSYADRARKAISPSNLAVKALSIVAHHSNPLTVDDWPQVGSQRQADKTNTPKKTTIKTQVDLVLKSPPNKSSTSANQKVMFGSIGVESPAPLSPSPAPVPEDIRTKKPTFSVGLDDSTEPPARLKSRTRGRLDTEDPESSRNNDPSPTSTTSTTQTPNKWKFGTTTSTPIVNGTKPLPSQADSAVDEYSASQDAASSNNPPSSSSLLFHQPSQPDTDSNSQKGRERGISFGYIDTPLPLDENISTTSKTKSKSKTKTKTKVDPDNVNAKPSPSPVQVNQVDDLDPTFHSNSNSNPNQQDKDVDPDAVFKVKDFGYGFGSRGYAHVQGEQANDEDNETGDNQTADTGDGDQDQQNYLTQSGLGQINDIPHQPPQTPPIHSPVPTHQHHGLLSHIQPHSHLSRSSRRGNTFGNVARGGGYGSYNHNHNHERGGYGIHERGGYERGRRGGGRGGMNGHPRGYASGRGYNRGGGGGPGPGAASSNSSPSSGGGQRVPYDNVTSPPALPPLPLHFSQLPQHGMDPMYYPSLRHGPAVPFDPYQPYPHLQQHSHLPPPHLQSYPHFQQVPPPLPPHLLASSPVSASTSNNSTSTSTVSSTGADDVPPSTSASPPPNQNLSSSSSTSPRSSTPLSSHLPPPVPIPLTVLPFPLDPVRYYLLGQLEYYLSPQNMVQDFFLRMQMDSKGYIPISLLASFNRIKQLTLDTRLVKEVLSLSAFVEVRGGMVRMAGVSSDPGGGQGIEGQAGQNQNQCGWEAFVLPDAVESVVEDVENIENGVYAYHNGYAYGAGYSYGYGSGYGYGYGYGYPPGPGLGYYEDPQSQQLHHQQQQQGGGGGYDPGLSEEGVEEPSSYDHVETVPPILNGHGTTHESTSYKLNDPHALVTFTKEDEEVKQNGILKHEEDEEEEEEEEEDVVFVMGTDVSTSWSPERERRV